MDPVKEISASEIANMPNKDRNNNVDCKNMIASRYCIDCNYCTDCIRCKSCYHCIGLTGKTGYIFNEPPGSEKIEEALMTGGFDEKMIAQVRKIQASVDYKELTKIWNQHREAKNREVQ